MSKKVEWMLPEQVMEMLMTMPQKQVFLHCGQRSNNPMRPYATALVQVDRDAAVSYIKQAYLPGQMVRVSCGEVSCFLGSPVT